MRMHIGRHLVNLALVGFMGAGKTSVGRIVAEQLHFEFLDTDALTQTRTGRTIAETFAQDGEHQMLEPGDDMVKVSSHRSARRKSTSPR